jgi:hypothetical protein
LSLNVERWDGSELPEAHVLRKRMEAEGYSVFESRDAAGTSYGPHSHAEDQSHWIVSGALTLRVGWEDTPCAQATVIIFRPTRNIPQSCTATNPSFT